MNLRLPLPAFPIPGDYLARLLHQGDVGWGVLLAGLAVLYAKHWLPEGQKTAGHAAFRYLPMASAAVIVCIGVAMTWMSLPAFSSAPGNHAQGAGLTGDL
jgi:hypothetical protein